MQLGGSSVIIINALERGAIFKTYLTQINTIAYDILEFAFTKNYCFGSHFVLSTNAVLVVFPIQLLELQWSLKCSCLN